MIEISDDLANKMLGLLTDVSRVIEELEDYDWQLTDREKSVKTQTDEVYEELHEIFERRN